MRRASTCLAVLGLAVLGLPAAASAAAPAVTFKAKAVPIPGFPHTGNILGAGAAVEAEYTIKGTEYGGLPAAADRRQLLPAQGHQASPAGVCDLLGSGAAKEGDRSQRPCPVRNSPPATIGPNGYGLGVVRFGKEVTEEKARVQGFFAPGGGLQFFTKGSEPASFEIISPGTTSTAAASSARTELTTKCRWSKRCPGPPTPRLNRSTSRPAPPSRRARRRSTTAPCRRSARRAASR